MDDPTPQEHNAAFVDRIIQRWEVLLEHHIRLRHGAYESAEHARKAEEAVSKSLGSLDRELATMRAEAREAERPFPLDQVVETYRLEPVEASILQLALAPMLDLSFRQRVARYNNNILLDFVDADLALAVLFPRRAERLMGRSLFAEDSRLVRAGLLTLTAPKDPKGSGVLAQELRPPERLADYVLGRRSLDGDLRALASLIDPTHGLDRVALPEGEAEILQRLVAELVHHGPAGSPAPFPRAGGLVLEVAGPPGSGKTHLAQALATEVRRPLVVVDAGQLAAAGARIPARLDALFTEARVQGAVLLFDRADPLLAKTQQHLPALLGHLERHGGLTILTTTAPDDADGSVERYVGWRLELELPEVPERLAIWELHRPTGVSLAEDVDLDDLSTRFEITGAQIAQAWDVAVRNALATTGSKEPCIAQATLKAAAQGQIRASMSDLSVRSKAKLTLEDLVLPDREKVLVQEVLDACKNRVFVMSKWGFGKRLVTGKGICVLFKGEPGTGKTLCSEILATELGMKLYQVSIPKIMSKYIGETEKNIAKIFTSARANHSMLLFDEADSLFTKRVSVENAVDRFSNMEVNLLLQEIERFEGVCILTTNLDKNIDDAFARRIQFKIDFPFPEPDHRAAIWELLIPKECPIDGDIDFEELGESFELSGGHIKNAVVRAAYRAASRQGEITWDDIEFAAEQECKNAGKLFRSPGSVDDW